MSCTNKLRSLGSEYNERVIHRHDRNIEPSMLELLAALVVESRAAQQCLHGEVAENEH